jgi:uncharacterized membrane protein YdbT with pleckstrin-like domain
MSYIDNNLLTDEHVVYRTHLHWIIFARPILWLLLAFLLYYLYLTYTPYLTYMPYLTPNYYQLVIAIPLLIAIFEAIPKLVLYNTSEFGVTDKRVIVKTGFIRVNSSENFLQKVENIQVHQSIWGRILGYGTIIIIGTGGTQEPFYLIHDPLMFRKQVQEQVGVLYKAPANVPRG